MKVAKKKKIFVVVMPKHMVSDINYEHERVVSDRFYGHDLHAISYAIVLIVHRILATNINITIRIKVYDPTQKELPKVSEFKKFLEKNDVVCLNGGNQKITLFEKNLKTSYKTRT